MALTHGNKQVGGVFLEGGAATAFKVTELQYPGQLGAIYRDGPYLYQVVKAAATITGTTGDAFWQNADGADYVVVATTAGHGYAGKLVSTANAASGDYVIVKRRVEPDDAALLIPEA